jgi:hypothetical protein
MLHLDLTEDECVVLRDLLALKSRDLSHEIHQTDSREYKAGLRHDEDLIRGLLERLGAGAPVVSR